MVPLLNAINTKFTGTSAITTALPGGLHHAMAQEGTWTPGNSPKYLVYTVVSGIDTLKYGGVSNGDVDIQFSAYGEGHDATYTAMKVFTDAFDDFILTLATGKNTNTQRLGPLIPMIQPKTALGNDVWAWHCTYRYTLTP